MKSFIFSTFLSMSNLLIIFVLPVSSASAELYYECKAGYSLQSKGRAVRCHRAGKTEVKPPKRCAKEYIASIKQKISLSLKVDSSRKEDQCIGLYKEGNKSKKMIKKVICPRGYLKKINAQKDTCIKTSPEKNLPPLKGVNK